MIGDLLLFGRASGDLHAESEPVGPVGLALEFIGEENVGPVRRTVVAAALAEFAEDDGQGVSTHEETENNWRNAGMVMSRT